MTQDPIWHIFENRTLLAERFADDVAAALRKAIAERGEALLALSGGTTPALFFRTLSTRELDWKDVTVVPVDERFVPTTSDRSNEKLIRDNLLTGKAAQARLVPLYHDTPDPVQAADRADSEVKNLPLPLDVVILGMGGDGHTASYFPDSPELENAIDLAAEKHVLSVSAPSADEPRLTLTLPVLLSAPRIALHIEGQDKRALFETVVAQPVPLQKPIGAVFLHAARPLDIYWAPRKGE